MVHVGKRLPVVSRRAFTAAEQQQIHDVEVPALARPEEGRLVLRLEQGRVDALGLRIGVRRVLQERNREVEVAGERGPVERGPGLKGSIGEGPNQTNYSHQSSVKMTSL